MVASRLIIVARIVAHDVEICAFGMIVDPRLAARSDNGRDAELAIWHASDDVATLGCDALLLAALVANVARIALVALVALVVGAAAVIALLVAGVAFIDGVEYRNSKKKGAHGQPINRRLYGDLYAHGESAWIEATGASKQKSKSEPLRFSNEMNGYLSTRDKFNVYLPRRLLVCPGGAPPLGPG